ncbi:MAG: hypothetical protein PHV74_07855 [Dehalococcoidia bacterium]|nr:hypothetical protein [Dehalococcoidia bacterium]
MSGYLLHQGATVMCAHSGQAQPTAPNARVKVNSQMVVTQSCTYTIAGCSFNVSGSPVPCVTGQWITAATRVKVGGLPVLLQDSQSTCMPNGTPMTVSSTQTRVRGT